MRTIIEMVNRTRLDCVLGTRRGDAPRRRRGDLARAAPLARSAGSLVDQPRCATCSPTWRSSPRRRRSPRLRLARAYDARSPTATRRRPSRGIATAGARSTGSASAAPATRPRRSSAWAATATSRSPGSPRLLPRASARLDLGGLGQRDRARRAARDGARARVASTAFRAECERAPRGDHPSSTPTSTRRAPRLARARGRGPEPPSAARGAGRGHGARAAGVSARARSRPAPVSEARSSRPGSATTAGTSTGRCRGARMAEIVARH